jgi:hypothetical protein
MPLKQISQRISRSSRRKCTNCIHLLLFPAKKKRCGDFDIQTFCPEFYERCGNSNFLPRILQKVRQFKLFAPNFWKSAINPEIACLPLCNKMRYLAFCLHSLSFPVDSRDDWLKCTNCMHLLRVSADALETNFSAHFPQEPPQIARTP